MKIRQIIAGVLGLGLAMVVGEAQAGPDLTITSLSAPTNAARGATISVAHTTKNVGDQLAGFTTTKFHLCTNNTACGYRNQQSVPSLAPGASKTLTNTSFSVPADQALGTNWIVGVCGFGITQPTGNDTNSIPIVITP
jgi:hypothetical protein